MTFIEFILGIGLAVVILGVAFGLAFSIDKAMDYFEGRRP